MLASLRIVREEDGVVIAHPTNISLSRDDSIYLRKYLEKKEIPTIGSIREEINDKLAEDLATIQYSLLNLSDLGQNVAWLSIGEKKIYLNPRYRLEISTYYDYVM